MNGGVATISPQSWQCTQCTLINNGPKTRCDACQAPIPSYQPNVSSIRNPHPNNNDRLLQKFPLISNIVAKIDSSIGAITTQINAFTEQNQVQMIENWLCPACNSINGPGNRYCSCGFDKQIEDKFFAWKCERCGLKQPQFPLDFKCPICRKRVSSQLQASSSKSLPDLTRLTLNVSPQLPTKQAEQNSREVAQIFQNIVEFCKVNGHSFIDDGFPHSNRSIGDLRQLDERDLKIVWLRPQDIRTEDGRRFRWSIFNNPKSVDIEQGKLGNCWVISALALIAERPELLERIFVTKEYNSYGVYQIRLCIDGLWKTVVVDDFFPCRIDKRTMIFAVGRNNQLWVSLVEKALAKNYGCYSKLRAGRMHEGLTTLTGYPCLQVDIDSQAEVEGFADMLWAQLYSALESKYLIGASCGAGRRPVDEREYQGFGLSPQHAYSVLNVATIGKDRIIRLRNPWGKGVWSGLYSYEHLRSNMELRRQLYPENASQGTFWMPFESFMRYYDAAEICCIDSNWNVVRYPINIGWNPARCGCVRLVVTETTHISISLFQQSTRATGRDNNDIMILVHEANKDKFGFPGPLIMNSERRVYDSINADGFLKSGIYMIYFLSLSRTVEAFVQPGGIAIHSLKPIHTEILPASMEALRSSLEELVIKKGRVEKTLDNCVARILTTNFAGLVVMVDNLASNLVLQVQSDCQQSTNVISTRGVLQSFDSIPPLHRQILTILSHFENTQPFSISHRMQVKLTNMPSLGNIYPHSPLAQHVPGYSTQSIFALHGPKSLYND